MCIISSVDIGDDQELRHLFFTAFPVIQTETWKIPVVWQYKQTTKMFLILVNDYQNKYKIIILFNEGKKLSEPA